MSRGLSSHAGFAGVLSDPLSEYVLYHCTNSKNNKSEITIRAERTSPLSVRDRYFLVCFGLSVIGFQVVNTIKGKKIN